MVDAKAILIYQLEAQIAARVTELDQASLADLAPEQRVSAASWGRLAVAHYRTILGSFALVTLIACGAEAPQRPLQPEPERPGIALLGMDTGQLQERVEELEAAQSIFVEAFADRSRLDPVLVGKLKANTGITLQWIGWEDRGTVFVEQDKSGKINLKGEQRSVDNQDFLRVSGQVVAMTQSAFVLLGTIEFDVQDLRERGAPHCLRSGAFTFRATGDRRYWRLVEKSSHCGQYADYVDIYF